MTLSKTFEHAPAKWHSLPETLPFLQINKAQSCHKNKQARIKIYKYALDSLRTSTGYKKGTSLENYERVSVTADLEAKYTRYAASSIVNTISRWYSATALGPPSALNQPFQSFKSMTAKFWGHLDMCG